MSQLISTPETLASTAADVQNIGSAINAASAGAAGQTTGLLAAAEDEVSAAIANLFGAYGQQYQAVLSQAATFHTEFTQALAAAASTYAQAEAAGAALLGQTAITGGASTGTSSVSVVQLAAGDPLYALIMGGTNNPGPDPKYVTSVFNAFIKPNPLFSSAIPQGLFTPEQFWPVTPQLGSMTFGQSVAKGVTLLNNALLGPTGVITQGNSAVVFGYSQSATIATNEINALLAAGSTIPANQLSFVLIGDPNNPVGGLLERFPGFYIPFLDVAFNGATPQSPWHTSVYTYQYDGIADAPQYPLNLVSDLNAFMGYFFVHGQYPLLTATQVGTAVPLPTNGGNTDYYMFMTQNLPLLEPIRAIPYAGPPIADIFQPDLRVLVDLGYADYGAGANYANIPTPAGLLDIPNPFTVIPDLALGAVQGPYGAAVEIGVESGLLSPSYFPNTYPWVPSINPGLNISLGQSSTTLLSVLSGAAGNVLHLIPPPNFP
ncbi:PE family protein [Mycobacterium sp. 852002-50816_SCH5313054-b]|uniref:PE family protein n=1 Tax=Mycobacterium sp. 852002-50816_SCH5313054-b TaxID=1834092 RepID=UPI0007FD826A|nr:PE-PPE domain-containing protein [Mycobacterium sp. 852002-50816_SCH5313054-b]OBF43706.1 PE family protein [Mycobacterium sp. 852002-50816_SCH5313054-b]